MESFARTSKVWNNYKQWKIIVSVMIFLCSLSTSWQTISEFHSGIITANSPIQCEIGELSFENIECSSDSIYFVTLNFDFGQTSDSFFLETRNLELGTFAYDDLPLRIEVPISGSADELLRVIDSQDNDCMRAGEFEVDCQTSSFISPPSIAVKLYPNPTSHFVVIQLEDQLKRQYQIRNLSGQLLQEKPFVSGEEIRLPDLAPGYYIVRIEIDGREWIQKPLVVQ